MVTSCYYCGCPHLLQTNTKRPVFDYFYVLHFSSEEDGSVFKHYSVHITGKRLVLEGMVNVYINYIYC